MTLNEVMKFVYDGLLCSVFVAPRELGLTYDEVLAMRRQPRTRLLAGYSNGLKDIRRHRKADGMDDYLRAVWQRPGRAKTAHTEYSNKT